MRGNTVFFGNSSKEINQNQKPSQIVRGSFASIQNIKNQEQEVDRHVSQRSLSREMSNGRVPSGFFRSNKNKTKENLENNRKLSILKDLLSSYDEMRHLPHADYFKFHPTLNKDVRRRQIEQIIYYSMFIPQKIDVVFDAVNMFDRLFSTTQSSCTQKEVALATFGSFYWACQNAGYKEFALTRLIEWAKHLVTEEELRGMIDYFHISINNGPKFISPLRYFDNFADYYSLNDQERHFGWMLLETSQMDYKMIDCLPSLQAMAAIAIISYYFRKKLDTSVLLSLLNHPEDVFMRVRERMSEFFTRIKQFKPESNVLKKFSTINYYKVSTLDFSKAYGNVDLIR